jgi:hypothetical protein
MERAVRDVVVLDQEEDLGLVDIPGIRTSMKNSVGVAKKRRTKDGVFGRIGTPTCSREITRGVEREAEVMLL